MSFDNVVITKGKVLSQKKYLAFTLIELLGVLSLVGILISLSFFSIASVQKNQLTEKTFRATKSTMEGARLYAMSRHKVTLAGFSFNESQNQIVLGALVVKSNENTKNFRGNNTLLTESDFEWISKPIYLENVGFLSNDEDEGALFSIKNAFFFSQSIDVKYGSNRFTFSHYVVFYPDGKTVLRRDEPVAGIVLNFQKLNTLNSIPMMSFYWDAVVGILEREKYVP